jgi:hypothetical protein
MIRNGYAKRLQADAERARLAERWQGYPGSVQYFLNALLRDHGLQAARLATKAVEEYAHQHQDPQEKEERDDATPPA